MFLSGNDCDIYHVYSLVVASGPQNRIAMQVETTASASNDEFHVVCHLTVVSANKQLQYSLSVSNEVEFPLVRDASRMF